jgi:hypothetical protein
MAAAPLRLAVEPHRRSSSSELPAPQSRQDPCRACPCARVFFCVQLLCSALSARISPSSPCPRPWSPCSAPVRPAFLLVCSSSPAMLLLQLDPCFSPSLLGLCSSSAVESAHVPRALAAAPCRAPLPAAHLSHGRYGTYCRPSGVVSSGGSRLKISPCATMSLP